MAIAIALAFAATWLLPAQNKPLPKPSQAMAAAYQKAAILNQVAQEKRASLAVSEKDAKEAMDAASKLAAQECPGCGYDPLKNEYVASPEKPNGNK